MVLLIKPMETQNRSSVGTSERPTNAMTSFVRSFEPRMPLRRSKKSFTMLRTTRKTRSSKRMAFTLIRLKTSMFCGSRASPFLPVRESSSEVRATTRKITTIMIMRSRLRRFFSCRCCLCLSVSIPAQIALVRMLQDTSVQ